MGLLAILIGSVIFGYVGMIIAEHKNASKPAGFWLGFFLWPFGLVIAALLGPTRTTSQQGQSAPTNKSTELDKGIERSLSNAKYKVWLIEAYGIEKNEVLGEFVCGEKSFKTVDEALEFAHAKQAEAEHEHQRREPDESTLKTEAEALGITFDGEFYHFKTYRYEKLKDAIVYARR